MPLSDRQIRNAVARVGRVTKLSDGEGLQLWVKPSGARLWNLAYRFDGKQRKLAIGPYPRVSLKDARTRRDEAKSQLDHGLDASQQKRLARLASTAQQANTFAIIADELLAQKRREGKAPATLVKLEWLFGLINPTFGARPISAIEAPEVLQVLRRVEARDRFETALRLRSVIGSVFRFAVATGRTSSDPTSALRGALIAPRVRPRAAIVDPSGLGEPLRAIDGHSGTPEVRGGLQLLALTFIRPGELRGARCAVGGDRLRQGDLDYSRRAHEDAPSASRSACSADDRCP